MSKDDDASKSDGPESIRQTNQSGGVNVFGGSKTIQGDVVGRDQVKQMTPGISEEAFRQLFVPLLQSLEQAPRKKGRGRTEGRSAGRGVIQGQAGG